MRAIFGDKAGDVKDASLKAQPSLHGVVIDTRLYSRANKEGKKGKSAEKAQLEKLDEKFAAEISELTKRLVAKLWTLLQGKATTGITDYFGVELYPAGTKFSQKLLEEIARKSTDEKLKIPDDMAIAGFHGHDIGQVMEPRLASVLTPRERMGSIGAERLLARIRGEAVTPKMLDLGFTLSPGGSI